MVQGDSNPRSGELCVALYVWCLSPEQVPPSQPGLRTHCVAQVQVSGLILRETELWMTWSLAHLGRDTVGSLVRGSGVVDCPPLGSDRAASQSVLWTSLANRA